MSAILSRIAIALGLLVALATVPFAALPLAQEPAHAHDSPTAIRAAPWAPETLELARALAVQDGGRVKPLDTFASFTLLRMNGKRSLTTPAGEKLGPIAWLLDVLFFPEQAGSYAVFQVQDIAAVREVGGPTEGKKKRDRYSFDELRPTIARLFERAREYGALEDAQRSSVQQQVLLLAENVDVYVRLATHLDFARRALPVGAGAGLDRIFGGREQIGLGELLGQVEALRALRVSLDGRADGAGEHQALSELLQASMELTSGTESLALLPPTGSVASEPAWYSPADLLMRAFDALPAAPVHLELLADLQRMSAARAEPAGFHAALASFAGRSQALAAARGEDRKIGLELAYYKAKLLGNAQVLFVLAFLLVAFLWLHPRARWLHRLSALTVLAATLLVVAAITMRCLIRERPPVSTLYETVLFVTAAGALTALGMEWINRQRIALSAAAVLGLVGLFIANGYETLDKRDTMPQLVAVLDTNFWLATHVTAITIGYSAGILAALLANAYLLARLFGFRRNDPKFAKGLVRMTYGALCFGLIFSVVGTILGGIWANESWGRFWGWDPKENGALLICLSQLVLLHLRMGGYVRDFGFAAGAAFGGTVIGFSWWGVNLLGVGLHSYGFTSGIHTVLWGYYIAQWSLIGIAGVHHWIERARPATAPTGTRPRGRARLPLASAGARSS